MSIKISNTKRSKIHEKTGGKCGYCGIDLIGRKRIFVTIDHIFPQSKGGCNGVENLILACRTCNLSKGVKTIDEFRFYCQWRFVMDFSGMNAKSLSWVIDNTNLTDVFNPPPVTFFFEGLSFESETDES